MTLSSSTLAITLLMCCLCCGLESGSESSAVNLHAVHQAVVQENPALVKELLAKGVALDAAGQSEMTALHLAAVRGWDDGCALLLEAGANPNVRDRYGWTPLHLAADNGDPAVVRRLLSAGAKVNAADARSSLTPLHRAAFKANTTAVELLLESGADPNAKTTARRSSGLTPLHWAASSNNPEAAAVLRQLIAAGGDPATGDEYAMTPLHFAALARNRPAVKVLIAAGAPLDKRNDRGQTPLHFAVEQDDFDTVSTLLKAGASATIPDGRGNSPHHYSFRMSEEVQSAFAPAEGNVLPSDGWLLRLDAEDHGREHHWYTSDGTAPEWEAAVIEQPWRDDYVGIGWYQTTIIPQAPTTTHSDVALRFEGVDEQAWVWLNGVLVGSHELGPSGWDKPFEVDISDTIRWNQPNTITVRVQNTVGAGGIWRPVILKVRDRDGKSISIQISQPEPAHVD